MALQSISSKAHFLFHRFDHIVSHFDGNNNDRDDIAALPIAALLTKAAGFEGKSTFFYNNNLGEKNVDYQVQAMRKSAAIARELGIQAYDYQSGIDKITTELVKILNSGQKVLIIEGGPMEATYRALNKVDFKNLSNIELLSHSTWNETRNVASKTGVSDVHTWADIARTFPEVTQIHIKDQNGGFLSSRWNWLDSASDPLLKEARALMKNAGPNKLNDPSDAGMHYYALTGNESGNPLDAKAFLLDSLKRLHYPQVPVSLKAVRFEAETADSIVNYRKEPRGIASSDQCLSFIGGRENETGSATFVLGDTVSGTYDIIVGTFDENDGLASFKVELNDFETGKTTEIGTLLLNANLASNLANNQTIVSPTVAQGVNLTPGDRITINGFENGLEHARLDYIQLNPVSFI